MAAFLIALPQTRWVVLGQARSLVDPPYVLQGALADLGAETPLAVPYSPFSPAILRQAEAKYPNDFGIQLACAEVSGAATSVASDPQLREDSGVARMTALVALIQRFPASATMSAQILRNATNGEMRMENRDQDDEFLKDSPWAVHGPEPAPQYILGLAAYDKLAADGERLDPKNAYFPMMRAVGLFQSHQDAAAIAAIERAGTEPNWNDYVNDAAIARWRLYCAVCGRTGAADREMICGGSRTDFVGGVTYPHLSALRELARLAISKAMEDERSGRVQDGFAIRHAVMRCGDLMRAQSASGMGVLAGTAINQMGMSRVGGGPALKRPAGVSEHDWMQMRRQQYQAYLIRIGHSDEARRVESWFDAGLTSRRIILKDGPESFHDCIMLCLGWIAGMLCLSNVLWFLIVGALSTVLWRANARWPMVLFFSAASLVGLFAAAISTTRWMVALAAFYQVSSDMMDPNSEGDNGIPMLYVYALPVAVAVALPLLATVIAFGAAAIQRASPAASLARVATTVGVVLLLAYAGVVALTVQRDNALNRAIVESLSGEGRYAAQQQHTLWPGVVP